MGFDWQKHTRPFYAHGEQPGQPARARFVLRQVDDGCFMLEDGFRYEPAAAPARSR